VENIFRFFNMIRLIDDQPPDLTLALGVRWVGGIEEFEELDKFAACAGGP
jgi:hypothetical protein